MTALLQNPALIAFALPFVAALVFLLIGTGSVVIEAVVEVICRVVEG